MSNNPILHLLETFAHSPAAHQLAHHASDAVLHELKHNVQNLIDQLRSTPTPNEPAYLTEMRQLIAVHNTKNSSIDPATQELIRQTILNFAQSQNFPNG